MSADLISTVHLHRRFFRWMVIAISLAPGMFASGFLAWADSCSVAAPHPLTPEQLALISGNYAKAEEGYRAELAKSPQDQETVAGLARTLLLEEKIPDAEAAVRAALAADPQSPVLLTALAEVQYRAGTPWEEEKTLATAQARSLCYPRYHLLLAEFYQLNSLYASALRQIQLAHQLDSYDPEIQRAWTRTLPLQQRIDELKKYLATNDADVATRRSAQYELTMLEDRLQNRASACHLASPVTTTSIDFSGIMVDSEHIRGWGLEVAFNDHKARLQVDTGASGLYISRTVAEHAGLKPVTKSQIGGVGNKGDQNGYVAYADSIKIGNLEFRNCIVQVSDRRDVVGVDGLIGMDVFSNFLVTLDFPWHRMTLGPLPPYPDAPTAPVSLSTDESSSADNKDAALDSTKDATASDAAKPAPIRGPHDRYIAPEMKNWTPVYRIRHDLMVPTALNGKTVRMFIVDTGAGHSSISPAAAREVTKVRADDRTSIQGISGNVQQVMRGDKIVVRFAHLQQETDQMYSFDMSNISKALGAEVSGFLGFDVLHLLVVRIDYRDGLVDFQYSEDRGYQHIR